MYTSPALDLDIAGSPVGVKTPYRVAPDTFVIPELVPGPPGTYVALNSMVITGAEPVIVDTGN
ncbi:MAG: hypothetical protein AB7V74_24710, partial [Acidimicrobiia bacterium]